MRHEKYYSSVASDTSESAQPPLWTTVLLWLKGEIHRLGITVRRGHAMDCRCCATAEWLRAKSL